MNNTITLGLAQLISYPENSLDSLLNEVIKTAEESLPEIVSDLKTFQVAEQDLDLSKLQEVYTRTFDLKALACLDVGFILFGEDYKRGAFLVQIQKIHKNLELPPITELPDHLPNMLRIINGLKDENEKKELVEKICLPAVIKLLQVFNKDENKRNVYFNCLHAIKTLFESKYEINNSVLKGQIC